MSEGGYVEVFEQQLLLCLQIETSADWQPAEETPRRLVVTE